MCILYFDQSLWYRSRRNRGKLSCENTINKRSLEESGPGAADILQAQTNHQEYDNGKFIIFKGWHQDSTRRKGQWDGGDLCDSGPDRNYRGSSQAYHHYLENHQGPGCIHGNPKVWDDVEPGCRRIPASVRTEGSRKGEKNKQTQTTSWRWNNSYTTSLLPRRFSARRGTSGGACITPATPRA